MWRGALPRGTRANWGSNHGEAGPPACVQRYVRTAVRTALRTYGARRTYPGLACRGVVLVEENRHASPVAQGARARLRSSRPLHVWVKEQLTGCGPSAGLPREALGEKSTALLREALWHVWGLFTVGDLAHDSKYKVRVRVRSCGRSFT